jgi:hypothetical protein
MASASLWFLPCNVACFSAHKHTQLFVCCKPSINNTNKGAAWRLQPCNACLATWHAFCTRKCTHTHTRTHARTHACTHARAHTHAHTRMHTHTRTHTHTRMHTHARTHTHTLNDTRPCTHTGHYRSKRVRQVFLHMIMHLLAKSQFVLQPQIKDRSMRKTGRAGGGVIEQAEGRWSMRKGGKA